jgi:VanZ family protein
MLATPRTRTDIIDLLLWVLTAASIALTLWMSLWEHPPGTDAFPHVDKVQHFVAYLVTSMLVYLAGIWRPGRGDGPFVRWRWPIFTAIVIGGAVIEVLQSSSGRDMELGDWLAEVVAVTLAFWLLTAWKRRTEGRDAGLAPG